MLTFVAGPSSWAGDPASTEMEQVVGRMGAVFSGRYQYKLITSAEQLKTLPRYEFTFSAGSWKRVGRVVAAELPEEVPDILLKRGYDPKKLPPRPGDDVRVELSHKGRYLVYKETPQHDGTMRHSSNVGPGEQSASHGAPPLVHLLGAGWLECTHPFVAANRGRAVEREGKRVNGVDTRVFEIPVSEADKYKAFNGVNDVTNGGGVLRLYVAPQLGYVVPRLEQVGKEGRVGATYDASDFYQAKGFWVPRRAEVKYTNSKETTFWAKYTDIQAERLNEIVDDEFVIHLPVGTDVLVSKDGKTGTTFRVEPGGSIPPDLSDVYQLETAKPKKWGFTVWWGVSIGLVVGFLVLAGLFAARIIRSRGKPA